MKLDHSKFALDTRCSNESPVSVAEPSHQNFASVTTSVSSLSSSTNDDTLFTINITEFTIKEVINKRLGEYRIEY
jgi:hypothetical protein